ncbi:MAG: response regulator [Deltaproteobacteria bacterium]|nr:response regulator [Deltaproteobacteria bacterium]
MITEDQILQASVLIVDDQAVNIQLLRLLLRERGFINVHSTTDSRQALDLYRAHSPDIVLLDLQMPNIDGFGVMAQLRQEVAHGYVPILILTGERDPEVRRRALQGGARDFLHKPFDPVETHSRIRNLIEMHLLFMQTQNHAARLESEVEARTHELRATQAEIIHRLGHAAEYKDNETGNHIKRMSMLCRLLAERVGLSHAEQQMLLLAAPMHDVGKIGIPDRILLKPGRLTPEEWLVMQTHAEIGADLLAGSHSPLIDMAHTVAWTHHERWDGTGYPRKLKGEDIPLVGRIAAICDVFDALTSARPYKEPWPVEDAIAELVRGKWNHFDGNLVDLFVAELPEIIRIREQFSED